MAEAAEAEAPHGCKMTTLGPLPEEWAVARLGDLASARYGKAKPKELGQIPVIGSGGVYGWAAEPLVDYPTLIVGRKGTAGMVWLQERPCWPSDTTLYFAWKTDEVDCRFIFHCLQVHPLSGEHAKTTLPSLQRPDLENYLVPLPPLPEQSEIARVLRAVDRKIEAKEQRKGALDALFKTLLHHLMTGKIRVAQWSRGDRPVALTAATPASSSIREA